MARNIKYKNIPIPVEQAEEALKYLYDITRDYYPIGSKPPAYYIFVAGFKIIKALGLSWPEIKRIAETPVDLEVLEIVRSKLGVHAMPTAVQPRTETRSVTEERRVEVRKTEAETKPAVQQLIEGNPWVSIIAVKGSGSEQRSYVIETTAQSGGGEEIPSFLRDNPWIDIIRSKGEQR